MNESSQPQGALTDEQVKDWPITLYDFTGNISDINALIVSREVLAALAARPATAVEGVPSAPIYAVMLDGKRIATASLRENADYAAHTSPGAVVVPCHLVPIAPQTATQPASEAVAPSPTAGMSMAQRILHVGGRNNAAGYVEFGSTQAVEALVRQVLRDTAAPAQASDAVLLQGGMPNSELFAAWEKKLPSVKPTAMQISAFAIGIEVGFAHAQDLERHSPRSQEARQAPWKNR